MDSEEVRQFTPNTGGMVHRVRRKIIKRLSKGREASVAQLLKEFATTPQAMSRHLSILRETGLVTHRTAGASRVYQLKSANFKRLARWMSQIK